jgi:hypothetical protein
MSNSPNSRLNPTYFSVDLADFGSIGVEIGEIKAYNRSGSGSNNDQELIPMFGYTHGMSPYTNKDFYDCMELVDIPGVGFVRRIIIHDEYGDVIQPTDWDDVFWQKILEAYATNGESCRPTRDNCEFDAGILEHLPLGEVLTRPTQVGTNPLGDDIEFMSGGVGFGEIPETINLHLNPNHFSFSTFTGGAESMLRHKVVPRAAITGGTFYPSFPLKRGDGSDLQSGDLTTADARVKAIKHLGSNSEIEYWIEGLGVTSGGGGNGGGGGTTHKASWDETVTNRANVSAVQGYTYIYSEGTQNLVNGATTDNQGIRNGILNPLHTGKGQRVKRAFVQAVAGATGLNQKAGTVFGRFKLYQVWVNGWNLIATLDLECLDISKVGINNDLSFATGSGLLRAEWEDTDGILLPDNALYGVVFEPANANNRLNAIGRFTLHLEGDKDFA